MNLAKEEVMKDENGIKDGQDNIQFPEEILEPVMEPLAEITADSENKTIQEPVTKKKTDMSSSSKQDSTEVDEEPLFEPLAEISADTNMMASQEPVSKMSEEEDFAPLANIAPQGELFLSD